MPNPFADTLHLRVHPSATHQALIVLMYGLALVVAAVLAIHRPVLFVFLPCVAAAGWLAWRRARLRTQRAIVRLRVGADGIWHWQQRSGEWQSGQIASAVCVGDWLVALGLRRDSQRFFTRPCLLFADALSDVDHRHLRARLTITEGGSSATRDAF